MTIMTNNIYEALKILHNSPKYRALRFWQFLSAIEYEFCEDLPHYQRNVTIDGTDTQLPDLFYVTDSFFLHWLENKKDVKSLMDTRNITKGGL